MSQLSPQENFTITRLLGDPTDTDIYYVQAVIRNARTRAVIDTVNLTDRGSQYFSKEWQVPADTSGEGFWITITSKVYTDSGYTTLSGLYYEELDNYLIQQRLIAHLTGGGGGSNLDYDKVRLIINEEIANIIIPDVNLGGINDELKNDILDVKLAVQGIEPTNIDLTPLEAKILALNGRIDNINIPKTDLQPILISIQQTYEDLEAKVKKLSDDQEKLDSRKSQEKIINLLEDFAKQLQAKQEEVIGNINKATQDVVVRKPDPITKNDIKNYLIKKTRQAFV